MQLHLEMMERDDRDLITKPTAPTELLGALVVLGAVRQMLNIYAQVGLVMLIGLACGNAILIVNLANKKMRESESALEAAKFFSQVASRSNPDDAELFPHRITPIDGRQRYWGPESIVIWSGGFWWSVSRHLPLHPSSDDLLGSDEDPDREMQVEGSGGHFKCHELMATNKTKLRSEKKISGIKVWLSLVIGLLQG